MYGNCMHLQKHTQVHTHSYTCTHATAHAHTQHTLYSATSWSPSCTVKSETHPGTKETVPVLDVFQSSCLIHNAVIDGLLTDLRNTGTNIMNNVLLPLRRNWVVFPKSHSFSFCCLWREAHVWQFWLHYLLPACLTLTVSVWWTIFLL